MIRTALTALGVGCLLLLGAGTASAQFVTAGDRVFLNVNYGGQSSSKAAEEKVHLGFSLYDETATVDSTRPAAKGGRFIDVTAGSVPLHHFGLAFNFMRHTATSDGALTASVPDPAYYDSPQTKSGTIAAMQHRETWVALLVVYQRPVMPKLDLTVMAGPSVARVRHEAVSNVSVDGATNQVSASLDNITRDLLGVQVGLDARYLLVKQLGVGGYVRYNAARGNLSPTLKVDVGGVQFGGGLRVRF